MATSRDISFEGLLSFIAAQIGERVRGCPHRQHMPELCLGIKVDGQEERKRQREVQARQASLL